MLRLLAVLAFLSACPAHKPPVHPKPDTGQLPNQPGAPKITWARVEVPSDVPTTPPPAGTYRIHLIDVGTGLSILVQGSDFNLLYDAGSNDKTEKPARVLAYLARAIGASGDDLCEGGAKDKKRIDDIVLSHPHFDHASALDLVVHCYDIKDIYDSGRVNDAVFYRAFLEAVAKSPAMYHTAADVPSDHTVGVKGAEIQIANWQRFSEGDAVALGATAKFTILHAEGKKLPDPNQNSVVILVELGGARPLLLVGDAESGPRKDPSDPPGDIEAFLIEQHAKDIRADILQVGHHGSKTSSRHAFITAVHPSLALVSSGPKVYGHTVLPDHEVIEELQRDGAVVLRTDERDADCPIKDRIGPSEGPGGCDSYIITVTPQ